MRVGTGEVLALVGTPADDDWKKFGSHSARHTVVAKVQCSIHGCTGTCPLKVVARGCAKDGIPPACRVCNKNSKPLSIRKAAAEAYLNEMSEAHATASLKLEELKEQRSELEAALACQELVADTLRQFYDQIAWAPPCHEVPCRSDELVSSASWGHVCVQIPCMGRRPCMPF